MYYLFIMENYIKTDIGIFINEQCIIWVKKMSECLAVCTKTTGCSLDNKGTHKICKMYNPDSYNKLNKHFEEKMTHSNCSME